MAIDIYAKSPLDGLEEEEAKLYALINDYRKQNGLPSIPASNALTTVANRHLQDVAENLQIVRLDDPRNPHSWSYGAYDGSDSSTWPNMWTAPQRLNTGYPGNGYENFARTTADFMSAEQALEVWKNSPPHNAVILNQGIWSDRPWNALGVGIYKGFAALWFGEEPDPTGEPVRNQGSTIDEDEQGRTDLISFVPMLGEVIPEFRRQSFAGITEPANQSFVFADFSAGNDVVQLTPEISRQNPGGVRAFDGDDLIVGSSDRDIVNGNRGNDTIQGSGGDDYLRAGQENDWLEGNDGNDILNGNRGDDTVYGGAGDDLVRGGQGNDLLIGGDGDDVLIGDFGTDTLTGGLGADKFIIRADTVVGETNPNLADLITDFGLGDEIVIVGNQETIQLVASGSDTVIQLSGGDILTVVANVTPGNLQGSVLAAFSSDRAISIG